MDSIQTYTEAEIEKAADEWYTLHPPFAEAIRLARVLAEMYPANHANKDYWNAVAAKLETARHYLFGQ